MRSSAFITLGLALAASARPTHVSRQAATDLANGKAAISDK
jgi:plasmid maintenance system antidote protein VapI